MLCKLKYIASRPVDAEVGLDGGNIKLMKHKSKNSRDCIARKPCIEKNNQHIVVPQIKSKVR